MQLKDVLNLLEALKDDTAVAGMARFGINTKNTFGISIPNLRSIAKKIGTDHALALQLWNSKIHEARILACMIDDPKIVTNGQIESWVKDFDSWDICDQCCSNLFDKTQFAYQKVFEWSEKDDEFVKRAGFALIAALAVHDKTAKNNDFLQFLPIIKREATDHRNFVKKAVNWALRQIGKRNIELNCAAIETAKEINNINSKSAKWIASDALRELMNEKIQKRLRK